LPVFVVVFAVVIMARQHIDSADRRQRLSEHLGSCNEVEAEALVAP
jgi:hypothetical protein